jgi:hypothetical protein
LKESATCLVAARKFDDCEVVVAAMPLLSEILDKIDSLKADANNFSKMMEDCKQLAEFCYDCLDGEQQKAASLFCAEISIFAVDKTPDELSEIGRILDNLAKNGRDKDVDLLRCRARLLTQQGEFDQASWLWSQICSMRREDLSDKARRSRRWWRAKYYEIYCWSELAETKPDDVVHTVEVLQSSYEAIPAPWKEKFSLLKAEIK